jgi:hypothetical protein
MLNQSMNQSINQSLTLSLPSPIAAPLLHHPGSVTAITLDLNSIMSLQISDVLTLTLPGFQQSAGFPDSPANPTSSPASLFSAVRWDAPSSALKLTALTEIIAGTNVTVTAPASMGIATPFSGSLQNQANLQLSAAAREGNVAPTRLTGSQPISSVIGSSQLSYSRQDGLAPTQIDFQFTAVCDAPPLLCDFVALRS